MIGQALQLVADRLNADLRARFAINEDLVALSPLSDPDGKPTQDTRNRLAIFLTGIVEDKVPRKRDAQRRSRTGEPALPMHLDIYFMVACGHDARIYGEGLKLLSSALLYFQKRPLWTPENTPEMPEGLSQLALEVANLELQENAHLWGNLGGRYVPSMMFKMRSICIDAEAITGLAPAITAPSRTLLHAMEGAS